MRYLEFAANNFKSFPVFKLLGDIHYSGFILKEAEPDSTDLSDKVKKNIDTVKLYQRNAYLAALAYKNAFSIGHWPQILRIAFDAYINQNYDLAGFLYLLAHSLGFELATNNLIFIIKHHLDEQELIEFLYKMDLKEYEPAKRKFDMLPSNNQLNSTVSNQQSDFRNQTWKDSLRVKFIMYLAQEMDKQSNFFSEVEFSIGDLKYAEGQGDTPLLHWFNSLSSTHHSPHDYLYKGKSALHIAMLLEESSCINTESCASRNKALHYAEIAEKFFSLAENIQTEGLTPKFTELIRSNQVAAGILKQKIKFTKRLPEISTKLSKASILIQSIIYRFRNIWVSLLSE